MEKEEAEAALAEALPALEEAAAALQDIRKPDIDQIRSYQNPNTLVKNVRALRACGMDAFCAATSPR